MLGFTVDYYRTDPDANGIDKVVFEYQLYNMVDMKQIKVLIPENSFPDNTVAVNMFNLDLFDTFKINVLKDEFKIFYSVFNLDQVIKILYISVKQIECILLNIHRFIKMY